MIGDEKVTEEKETARTTLLELVKNCREENFLQHMTTSFSRRCCYPLASMSPSSSLCSQSTTTDFCLVQPLFTLAIISQPIGASILQPQQSFFDHWCNHSPLLVVIFPTSFVVDIHCHGLLQELTFQTQKILRFPILV